MSLFSAGQLARLARLALHAHEGAATLVLLFSFVLPAFRSRRTESSSPSTTTTLPKWRARTTPERRPAILLSSAGSREEDQEAYDPPQTIALPGILGPW